MQKLTNLLINKADDTFLAIISKFMFSTAQRALEAAPRCFVELADESNSYPDGDRGMKIIMSS